MARISDLKQLDVHSGPFPSNTKACTKQEIEVQRDWSSARIVASVDLAS